MNINKKLIGVVSQFVPICVPNFYPGESNEYAEFEVDTTPDWYFDGVPYALRYDVLLRWYMPPDKNAVTERLELSKLLEQSGFSVQSIEDTSDDLSQCYEYYLRYWESIASPEEANDENQG